MLPMLPTINCCLVYHLIQERRIRFFGYAARAEFQQDHHRVIEASLRPPSHWRGRPYRRPRIRYGTVRDGQLNLAHDTETKN